MVFLDLGYVKLDTNDIENDIRPFVLGRKAWLFSGSPEGAKRNAIQYSMIITVQHIGTLVVGCVDPDKEPRRMYHKQVFAIEKVINAW